MKRSHLYYVMLVLFSFPGSSQAQALASNQPVPHLTVPGHTNQGASEKSMPLKNALTDLKLRYKVSFVYESRLIEDKTVKGFTMEGSLDEALNRLLAPFNLEFRKDKNVYVIVSKVRKEEASIHTIENRRSLLASTGSLSDVSAEFSTIRLSRQVELKSIYEKAINIRGRVVDDAGEGLPGVNVIVKGTTTGTTTTSDGNYSLTAPDGNGVLVFSYIGYTTEEVPINNRSVIDVTMVLDVKTLSEIVVVGYGEQKKETLTGSVTTVKGSEVVQAPVTNVSNSLAGRLPGLTAVTRSSEPGYDGSTIRIRGANTLGNNDALIVVDGIPGRSLDRIDPNTIESITVLKDASAAIYGAQAANGVILITTKRGKVGKPEIQVNLNQGYGRPTRIPQMANSAEYAILLNEIDMYRGRDARYSPEQIQKYRDGSDPWRYPDTDWFDAVLKPWSGQAYGNVSVQGGSESLKYFLLVGARNQDGYYHNSATRYSQYDFRSNVDGKISEHINIGFDVAGRQENRFFPTRGAGSIFWMTMRGKPHMHAFWPNGMPGPDIEYGDNPSVISTDATGYDRDKWYVLNSNVKLNITVPWVKGLSFTSNAGVDKALRFRKRFETPWYLYSWDGQSYDANGEPVLVRGKKGFNEPQLTQEMADNSNILVNAMINYDRTIANVHNIRFLVGTERRNERGDNFSAFRRNLMSTAVDQLFTGAPDEFQRIDGRAYQRARLNYFGRVNYSFQEKYLMEFVWRYDGTYQFPQGKRYGFFPGVSAGWRISEEAFWKNNISVVNNLKVRGSWGQTGNDRMEVNGISQEWNYMSIYDLNYPVIFGIVDENRTLQEVQVPNPNATWEVANQSNIGLEAQLFNGRLSIETDFFYNLRSNILWRRNASIPKSAGFQPPYENIGKVANRGWEFNIGYNGEIGALRYQVGLNGGYAKNKILFWDEAPGAPEYQLSTGRPMNTGLYYESIGIFRDEEAVKNYPHWSGARPGDVIFRDVNGDGKIDANDRVRNDLSNIPLFTGGATLNLQFKGFDLAILFQGAAGAVRYLSTESGEIGNFTKDFFDNRWTPENPDATQPRTFNRGDEYWRNQSNTHFLQRSDYLRLKNVQFGYNLPATLTRRFGAQGLRVYLSGFNLLTYSPGVKDFDPESDSANGTNYPLQKVVNGGLTLTF